MIKIFCTSGLKLINFVAQRALFDYQDDKIGLKATGAGGLESVSPLLPEDGVAYFVLNVDVKDQDEGGELFSNNKNIFVTWVGTKCKPMTKAKSSQHRRPLYQYALVRPPPQQKTHLCC